MSIIGWIVFGLVVGLVARAIMPGKQHMGVVMTTVLGIAGSLLGGFVASMFTTRAGSFQGVGWIGSIIGAILLLAIAAAVKTGPPRAPIDRRA